MLVGVDGSGGALGVVAFRGTYLDEHDRAAFEGDEVEVIGRGETTRRIASKLHLSPKTIETYRENIKHKLNLENATELTQYAVQWVLENR